MTDSVEALLKKAMSTESDSEALNCIRLASKKYNGDSLGISEFNGKSAEYWYNSAKTHYTSFKKQYHRGNRLSFLLGEKMNYRYEIWDLKNEVKSLKTKNKSMKVVLILNLIMWIAVGITILIFI